MPVPKINRQARLAAEPFAKLGVLKGLPGQSDDGPKRADAQAKDATEAAAPKYSIPSVGQIAWQQQVGFGMLSLDGIGLHVSIRRDFATTPESHAAEISSLSFSASL